MMQSDYLSKPWQKSYNLGPYKLESSLAPYPQLPVFSILDATAKKHPNQTAILFGETDIKYRNLKVLTDKLANSLIELGVQKGDRVCLYLPNSIELIISIWAILKAGATVVPTSILRKGDGLIHEISASNSKLIICREDHLDVILAIKDKTHIEHILVTSNEGYEEQSFSRTYSPFIHNFYHLIERAESTPPGVTIDPTHDLCELAFTGGATGAPKGVMLTHFNRYCSIVQGFPWIMKPLLKGFEGKSSILLAIPLFHSYGHFSLLSAAFLGLRILLLEDPRDTEKFAEYIETYRPFLVPGVPTQYMRIINAKLSRMNTIFFSGSAPLPLETAKAFKERTGMPISEGYGLTETSTACMYNLSSFSKITGFMPKQKYGIGIPTPDTDCRVIDPESGEDVPFGEAGEIVIRGPQVMKGYYPEENSGLTDDGWLHTGDIGYMDEDGYFHLVDRIKDMVNISGLKVYTTEVDEVLYKHPAVLMAASFGVPDPKIPGSERVMAVIQLKPDEVGKISEKEISGFCRELLPPYAVPKFIEFRDELPLTVTEKVFKKALRDEVLARMA